jgi:hypothetical protein
MRTITIAHPLWEGEITAKTCPRLDQIEWSVTFGLFLGVDVAIGIGVGFKRLNPDSDTDGSGFNLTVRTGVTGRLKLQHVNPSALRTRDLPGPLNNSGPRPVEGGIKQLLFQLAIYDSEGCQNRHRQKDAGDSCNLSTREYCEDYNYGLQLRSFA